MMKPKVPATSATTMATTPSRRSCLAMATPLRRCRRGRTGRNEEATSDTEDNPGNGCPMQTYADLCSPMSRYLDRARRSTAGPFGTMSPMLRGVGTVGVVHVVRDSAVRAPQKTHAPLTVTVDGGVSWSVRTAIVLRDLAKVQVGELGLSLLPR